MKKIDIGQAVSLLANLGVIAGIIFLGFELRQATVVAQGQARNEITRMMTEAQRWDSELVPELLPKLASGTASPQDRFRLLIWADVWLQLFQNLHYQNRQGLFEQSEYQGTYRKMEDFINSVDLIRDRYCQQEEEYSVSFQELMSELLRNPCS